MSRAFVKEDDAGQPPIIPPRAALPLETPNYVTPRGLELLRKELTELENKRSQIETGSLEDSERTRQLTVINAQQSDLTQRIASARVIDPGSRDTSQVRFGATVTLRTIHGLKEGTERKFTIVGVDEASVSAGLVAFVAPIARALIGARTGQRITLQMGRIQEEVEIVAISYQ